MSIPTIVNGKVEYIHNKPNVKWTPPYSNAYREFIRYAGKLQALALANELPTFDTGNKQANDL
jgi:hypothetical protein